MLGLRVAFSMPVAVFNSIHTNSLGFKIQASKFLVCFVCFVCLFVFSLHLLIYRHSLSTHLRTNVTFSVWRLVENHTVPLHQRVLSCQTPRLVLCLNNSKAFHWLEEFTTIFHSFTHPT